MDIKEIEGRFIRAFEKSFSKKKILFVFPILFLCSLIIVYCSALTFNLNSWLSMSLIFFSIFFSAKILLALGVLLTRIYYHEVKELKFRIRDLFKNSIEAIFKASIFSFPFFFIFLFLWTILGFFFFFSHIPKMGEMVRVIFVFAPFLLILATLFLCILNIVFLFLAAPFLAFYEKKSFFIFKKIVHSYREKILSYSFLFLLAILPVFFIGLFLWGGIYLVQLNHFFSMQKFSFVLQWFFLSSILTFFLSPFVIFFFNFSAETYQLLKEK